MADHDEGQETDRPAPRRPRVVTGDMVRNARAPRVVTGPGVARPPTTDVPAETLVAPTAATATPPPPPAATPSKPRPPRAAARRPATSASSPVVPPPPLAAPAVEPEPEPEPWRPIEVTRNVPPPVHRAAPPPPPPNGKPSKPPKPGKVAKAGKPPKPPKAAGSGSGAGVALVLALVSIVSAGVLAIAALVVAGRAKKRGASRGLVAAARLVAVVSLVGWLTVAGVVVAKVVRPDGVDYASLKVGDCIDTPEGTEVRRLTVRTCTDAHDAEVFAVVVHPAAPGDAFPGATALLEYAANLCLGQPFTDYVGVPRAQSQLTEFEIVPESEAWTDGRRGLVCAIDNADRSPLTASVKGAAR